MNLSSGVRRLQAHAIRRKFLYWTPSHMQEGVRVTADEFVCAHDLTSFCRLPLSYVEVVSSRTITGNK